MSAPSAQGGKFGSRMGFIFAAAGSAIGLGNIWRFPYTTGEYGGAAFVLVYIGFVVLIGVPVLLAELSIGRASGKNPVGAFAALDPGEKKRWSLVGGLGVLTGFGILSFYAVIAGWTVSFLIRALSGTFAGGMTPEQSGELFTDIIASPGETVGMSAVFLLLTALVVRGGVSGGIERAAKILMPVFFLMLVILAGRAVTLPGADAGLRFLFAPDFSKLTPAGVMSALGQALFSLSLGMGAMITYGSYLQKKERLPVAGISVAIFDTLIAILAGLIIFPALFSAGATGAKGPGLVFVVMPAIFDKLPAGQAFGVAFYALLAVAALTSTMSLLEVVVAYFVGQRGWSREKAVWVVSGACFLMAVPSALSQGAVDGLGADVLGESFLDIMNILWGNVALGLGALLIAVFAGWRWGVNKAVEEMGGMPGGALWGIAVKYVCPIGIAVIMIYSLVNWEFL
ncbi:MAG: sodium-dependent transporter [Deltaproteobacteria bacterium]|nr:sodium-dependent transporter [Deltaproteobacteria bacterium]